MGDSAETVGGIQNRFDLDMFPFIYRLRARWRIIRNSGDMLNRRVEVEQVLLDVARGKRGPLSPEECKALAYKLGVPSKVTS